MRAKIRDAEIFFDVDGCEWVPSGNCLVQRPTLFLLHGGPGGDHASFKSQVTSKLRDVAQLVYVDHRGSGRSTPVNPESYTLDNNIDDLEALRQYLGLERISVLGSSYGGMVAQGYAIRYPKNLANLVLVATAPSHQFLDDARQFVQARGTPDQIRVCEWLWNENFQSQEQLFEYYKTMGPMYSTTFNEAKFNESWGQSIRNFEQLNFGFNAFLKTFDYTDQLHTIACPTLVLAGAHDWICAPRHSKIIAERIPRSHLKIFTNSAHSIAQDEPEEFVAAVRGFLTYAPQ